MKHRCLAPRIPGLLSFDGPDAERFLNGQLTQDVRNLSDKALPSCVTDAKGRLQAYVHMFRGENGGIWIEAPSDQAEELEARLTRYLIADDVEVANLTGRWQLIHLPSGISAPTPGTGFSKASERLGGPGTDLWLPAGELPGDLSVIPPDEAEQLRIQARVPGWGTELLPGMLPPEAGLDRTAISYQKGCYIGQEVLSRIKSAGRLNRRLAAFVVGDGIVAGDILTAAGSPRLAGTITSVSPLPGESGGFAALGYLDKSAFDGAGLTVSGKPGDIRTTGFV